MTRSNRFRTQVRRRQISRKRSSTSVWILSTSESFASCSDRIASDTKGWSRVAAPTATECLIVLTSRFGPQGRTIYERIRAEFNIGIIPYAADYAIAAMHAFTRFGKGRHPAGLNFGDCMTYAAARVGNEPLVAIGDHFTRTDLEFDGGVLGRWPA